MMLWTGMFILTTFVKKLLDLWVFFYKLTSFIPKEALCKLYYAFVFPYINFGVEVYANCSKTAIDKLNKINNKLLRILLDKNYDTPNIELYRSFNVLPIPLLHEFKLLELIHKFYHHNHLLPEIFQGYFITNNSIHQYSTRNKHNLHISTVNSSMGQRCSVYRGSKYWNDLPDYFKSISSVFLFKKNIKNYLLWRWLQLPCCRYCSYQTCFKSNIYSEYYCFYFRCCD